MVYKLRKDPTFTKWLSGRDSVTQYRVAKRLDNARDGHFGKNHAVKGGHGLRELVFDVGPGYRVYYGIIAGQLIVVMGGGDKDSQTEDIKRAVQRWLVAKEENDGHV